MFFRFSIFFLTLLFAVNLWTSVNYLKYSSWFGIVFTLVIILITRIIVRRWKFTVLPIVLVPGSVFLLSLIDSVSQIRAFILLTSLVFYVTVLAGWRLRQYPRDETAKAMYNIATITSLFLWFAASYGWYLNIPVPVWGLMLVFSLVTFFVALVSLTVNQIDPSKRLLYALFLALLSAQVIWIQNFWPFGYLTTSVISLIIFYVAWSIVLNYFSERTSTRSIAFDVIFLVSSVSLILLSTRWYPVL